MPNELSGSNLPAYRILLDEAINTANYLYRLNPQMTLYGSLVGAIRRSQAEIKEMDRAEKESV